MNYRRWNSGVWVAVLCQIGTLAACGGSATNDKSDASGAGTGGGVSGSGDGDSGDGDGDSSGSGAAQMGTGGAGDVPIFCPDIGLPQASILLVGAPAEGGRCLATLEITGYDTPPNLDCLAAEEGCGCGLWDGFLIEGMNTIRVLDEQGALVTSYSGPYPLAQATDPCPGPRYEPIEINYVVAASPPSVSCERSGIVEFCSPGEGCCNCGCGVVTDTCTQEIACPAHDGPICGNSQCREGTICCDPDAAHCAQDVADCPE